jgi:hypothetical protein
VRVTRPVATPVRVPDPSVARVAMVELLTDQVASGRRVPVWSIAVNVWLFPTNIVTGAGVTWSEVGAVIFSDTLTLAVAEFPALSIPVTVIEFDTELSGTAQEKVVPDTIALPVLQNTPPTPDKVSVIEPDTATYGVLTVEPFVGLVMAIVGGVRSKFTVALVDTELPPVSTAVPVTDWPAPSVLNMAGEVQLCIGAPPGTHVNVTVALELFQPFEFGVGDTSAVMPGFATSANLTTNAF